MNTIKVIAIVVVVALLALGVYYGQNYAAYSGDARSTTLKDRGEIVTLSPRQKAVFSGYKGVSYEVQFIESVDASLGSLPCGTVNPYRAKFNYKELDASGAVTKQQTIVVGPCDIGYEMEVLKATFDGAGGKATFTVPAPVNS